MTGVPSLRRLELETACEQFSNIIGSLANCTLYKGTLSSGVEIAVISTIVTLAEDWSEQHEAHFRNKVPFCLTFLLTVIYLLHGFSCLTLALFPDLYILQSEPQELHEPPWLL